MLDHVEIYVSNLPRSEEFWSWLFGKLGYELYQSWPMGRSWRQGVTYIVLVQTEEKYLNVSYHRCRTGLNHLAFRAPSIEFVDTLRAELKAREVPLLYDDRFPEAGGKGSHGVFFEDPDRIKVEVVWKGE